MIRDFSKCGSNLERIQFLKSLASKDYDGEDLKSICQVMSFQPKEGLSKEKTLISMVEELEQRMKDQGMGIHKVSQRIEEMDTFGVPQEPDPVDPGLKNMVDALFIKDQF